jgi:hypothetical protein
MMGTLAGVLARKKIRTFRDRYEALVTGDIEEVAGTLKITRIHVAYRLRAPEDRRQAAYDALENYIHLCPGAQSVTGCIQIDHELTFIPETSDG